MALITLPAPRAFVNTPKSLLASVPCLACLSEKELLAALVGILATAQSKTVTEVMRDSACFKCMSKKQMLQALVTILGNEVLGESATVAQVIDEYKCLVCTDEKTLLAAILQLLGAYLEDRTISPLPT